jgi:hypothetical protein
MKTVYIVSNSGHDYSTAQNLGVLKFLYDDKINVFASDKLVKELRAKLEGSTPADYVLPSGNSLATCLTFAILLDLHGIVNILIYSFRNRMFEVRSISKNQIEQEAK